MQKVRIGVVGVGSIAALHLKAYQNNPRAELVAVADINAERANSVAKQWGAARAYSDAAELFADPDVDAVSICTWNNTHAELAIAAVQAGKHVLVEKPMCRTYAEAQQLEDVVNAHDRVVQVGFVRRHSANCRVLKSFIDAGDLGDIYYAKASCIRRMGNPGGWFANKSISGGGPLIDIGVHVIDLCWYLMGTPRVTSVSANTYEKLGNRSNITTLPRYQVADYDPTKNDVEDMANALIRFDNGASLIMDTSFSLHATSDSLNVSVYGDKGGADLEPKLQIASEKHETLLKVTPQIGFESFDLDDGFGNEIGNFVAACLGEAESIAPAWQGAEMMKILDGVYTSAAQGKEVQL
ncbi:Gfo/Idh/MocA family oxidoreductase [Actinopolymorpha sp. NPDC004070]|uniref:Gfo/Idh/MocA family protein n=1 Tax=Actinopolymorpha sp. NPDC004070 TaxID=3154548 RepID=UPI0033A8543D